MTRATARCLVDPKTCSFGKWGDFLNADVAGDVLSLHVALKHPRLTDEQLDAMFKPELLAAS